MASDSSFQPFADRLSRDIRNDLSKSFLLVLAEESIEPALSVAGPYLANGPPTGCREYIEQRLKSYRSILGLSREERADPLSLCFTLWDEGLFFEIHEILEPLWLKAEGEEKLLHQALIRAAGVYIKHEAGYPETAARIAAKALPILERNRALLERYTDADLLFASLLRPTIPPPRLRKLKRL